SVAAITGGTLVVGWGLSSTCFCGFDGASSAGEYGRGSGEGASGSIQVFSAPFAANTSEDGGVFCDSTEDDWERFCGGAEATWAVTCPPRPRSTAIGTIINSSRISRSSVASSLLRARPIDCTTPCTI